MRPEQAAAIAATGLLRPEGTTQRRETAPMTAPRHALALAGGLLALLSLLWAATPVPAQGPPPWSAPPPRDDAYRLPPRTLPPEPYYPPNAPPGQPYHPPNAPPGQPYYPPKGPPGEAYYPPGADPRALPGQPY